MAGLFREEGLVFASKLKMNALIERLGWMLVHSIWVGHRPCLEHLYALDQVQLYDNGRYDPFMVGGRCFFREFSAVFNEK